MGYDAGILKDEMHPQWPFKPEYEAYLESWKDPQNPTSWMKKNGSLLHEPWQIWRAIEWVKLDKDCDLKFA